MNDVWKKVLQSIAVTLVAPGLMFSSGGRTAEPEPVKQTWIPVLKENGKIVAMELEEYISRVVLGEMPASFDEEALKAQAVAARTYTLRMIAEENRHQGAVCTDYRCCQEYLEPEDYIGVRGNQEHVDKVFQAVKQTAGEVVCYDGDLICATYFASAGCVTEDASAVWGQEYPYLVSVPSPEKSKYDGEQVRLSFEEFQRTLGRELRGNPWSWFGPVTYTVGNGVDTIWIGAEPYSGVQLRALFGLRSTVFEISVTESEIVFETVGYGHRVGLSQYGANALAQQGYDYTGILSHYYRGTTLEQYNPD